MTDVDVISFSSNFSGKFEVLIHQNQQHPLNQPNITSPFHVKSYNYQLLLEIDNISKVRETDSSVTRFGLTSTQRSRNETMCVFVLVLLHLGHQTHSHSRTDTQRDSHNTPHTRLW